MCKNNVPFGEVRTEQCTIFNLYLEMEISRVKCKGIIIAYSSGFSGN